ncbi:MAG: hypothetical protein AAF664_24825 [Planctomycetota bacterium]
MNREIVVAIYVVVGLISSLLASASPVQAQLTVSSAEDITSAGGIGSSENDSLFVTYTGNSAVFTTLDFMGNLTEEFAGTFASEADFDITVNGSSNSLDFDSSTQGDFSNTINVTRTVSGFFWANPGDQFRFEAFESFDDNGADDADATWNDVSFSFSGTGGSSSLGTFQLGQFTIDTLGSGYDTEIAIYTSDGQLIDTNDDVRSNTTQSEIVVDLVDGDYTILVGGFNSIFGDQASIAGNAGGDYVLSIDGSVVASGSASANQFAAFGLSVTSVPEPSTSLALLPILMVRFSNFRRRRLVSVPMSF